MLDLCGSCKWYLRKLEDKNNAVDDDDNGMVRHSQRGEQLLKEGLDLIVTISKRLSFPIRTKCTALLYFQVFYSVHSTSTYPPTDLALTSLLVASKVEETVVKVSDILLAVLATINECHGDPPKITDSHIKKVTQHELALLDAINFNFTSLNIVNLYSLLETKVSFFKREKGLTRTVESFLHSSIILFYPLEMIIISSIYLDMLGAQSTTPLHQVRVELGIGRRVFDHLTEKLENLQIH